MRKLVDSLPGSLIRDIANAAMGRPGIIPLWFGESDLPTAPAIRDAAAASLARGETHYSHNLGLPALRQAIVDYQQRLYGASPGFDNVAITSSGLNAILLAMSAIVDPGDEVVVLTPTWPNLVAVPTVLNAHVRLVPLVLEGSRFTLDLQRLVDVLGPKTRAVLINSPQNPTGWRMPADDMAALVTLLGERGIWLVADEVYARLQPGGTGPSFLPYVEDDARVIVINSFSKAWAMTGWRLGWITGPRRFVGALERLIEFNTSCAPVFVQQGGIAALGPEGDVFVAYQQARLDDARTALIEALAGEERLLIPETEATFYLFPQVRDLKDGVALARRAVEMGVGLAPGEAFGPEGQGHIRLCYARDPEEIRQAAARLRSALA